MSTLAIASLPTNDHAGRTSDRRWDLVGMAASAACAVHCLAAPFLLLFLPAFGAAWSRPWVHWAIAAFVLPVAFIVIGRGYRAHRRRSTLALASLGAAAIIAGLFLPEAGGLSFTLGSTANAAPPPALMAADPLAAPIACTDTCCPSVAIDAITGATRVGMPWGSTATLAGGLLLVLAHGLNLYGCHCAGCARANTEGNRGCPAHETMA
ncbi:MAG: MerC domain-containing protein [Planctomycetota bacterium]